MPLCEYDMNPDEDFVLHGRPAPIYWARPRYLTNSELTTTTLNADGAPAFSSSKLLDTKSVSFQNGLDHRESLHRQHQQEQGDLRRTTSSLAESLTDNELVRTGSSFAMESRSRTRSLRGLPASSSQASWYTRLRNAPMSNGVRSLSPAPITRTVGSLGAKLLATKEVEREMEEEEDRRHDRELLGTGHYMRHDDLARRYFPVTLGASFDLGHDYREGEVRSPPPEVTRSRSRSRSRTRDDGRYVKVSTSTNGAVRQSLASPYELELGRLRMERLRIEEERLLELKRQEELERTRGPRPRWYELKNTDFHIEANRNNTLLRNEEYWDDMLKYRSQLSNASKEFRRSWDGVALY